LFREDLTNQSKLSTKCLGTTSNARRDIGKVFV
jgi:hypothetical protein